jgi:hypothetical protein
VGQAGHEGDDGEEVRRSSSSSILGDGCVCLESCGGLKWVADCIDCMCWLGQGQVVWR